jgi:hypothetical protein
MLNSGNDKIEELRLADIFVVRIMAGVWCTFCVQFRQLCIGLICLLITEKRKELNLIVFKDVCFVIWRRHVLY